MLHRADLQTENHLPTASTCFTRHQTENLSQWDWDEKDFG
jgi:hypothetical protein